MIRPMPNHMNLLPCPISGTGNKREIYTRITMFTIYIINQVQDDKIIKYYMHFIENYSLECSLGK